MERQAVIMWPAALQPSLAVIELQMQSIVGEAGSNYVASSTAAVTGCDAASDAEHCWRGRQ